MKIKYRYEEIEIPDNKKVTGKICFISDLTLTNCDLDSEIHLGFTIGTGKTLYWYITWTQNGHAFVYRQGDGEGLFRRWVSGDQEITVHFK